MCNTYVLYALSYVQTRHGGLCTSINISGSLQAKVLKARLSFMLPRFGERLSNDDNPVLASSDC